MLRRPVDGERRVSRIPLASHTHDALRCGRRRPHIVHLMETPTKQKTIQPLPATWPKGASLRRGQYLKYLYPSNFDNCVASEPPGYASD